MNKLRTLVDNILVPHSAFTLALQRLEQCFVYAEQGASEPVCVAVIGESRTGKSRSGEVFAGRHPRRRLDDGIQCPVLGLVVPSKPTVKSLAELTRPLRPRNCWSRPGGLEPRCRRCPQVTEPRQRPSAWAQPDGCWCDDSDAPGAHAGTTSAGKPGRVSAAIG